MNFFERQAEARRLSRRLILLFAAAVLTIVVAVDAVVVVLIAMFANGAEQRFAPLQASDHLNAIAVTSVVVLAVIAIASAYKTRGLSAGGGAVAKSMGGVRVSPTTTDPQHKRLLNIVEEMAIASGLPVPEVYVLEHEDGINAFAAGYTPARAAIAVTRGALDNLNRSELQGVIAHEFSHVLNGDMRLNTRLIGLLFGILVIALAGRTVLRLAPRGGSRKNGGAIAAILLAAFAIMVVGYIGLFFGRLIQAAVSRSRERLADASAVQFTRDPQGLRGALVKIGAVTSGSRLQDADAENVAHLLFAPSATRWFATHPSLEDRIKSIDPTFRANEFERVRAALMSRQEAMTPPETEAAAAPASSRDKLDKLVAGSIAVTPAILAQLTATPNAEQIAMAHTLRESLPDAIANAAHDARDATAVLFALALDADVDAQSRQLKFIAAQLGEDTSAKVSQFLQETRTLNPLLRLPALQHVLTALRQLGREERTRFLACLNGLLQREGRVSVEQYAVRKLAQVHLHDLQTARPSPAAATLHGKEAEIGLLLSVLAQVGHTDPMAIRRAYDAGIQLIYPRSNRAHSHPGNWAAQLDVALTKLDRLMPAAKELLLQAMTKTIAHDGMLTVREVELLRTICATLHCPAPVIAPSQVAA